MRAYLTLLLIITCSAIYSQKPCYQKSRLYLFDKHNEPRLFTDPLGRHPQFPFLQRVNGITTPEKFIASIRDSANRKTYSRTFRAFDLLLRNSGFWHGYKDLSLKNVRKVYITPGTIGNLGFYDKVTDIMNYLYVKLNPAGEAPEGVEAWKLINKQGCYLYILFTCGNAFYPNGDAVIVIGGPANGPETNPGAGPGNQPGLEPGNRPGAEPSNRPGAEPGNGPGSVPANGVSRRSGNAGCCKTLTIEPSVTAPPQQNDSILRPVQLRMNYYKSYLTSSHRKGVKYDTATMLVRHKDTLLHFKDRRIIPVRIDSSVGSRVFTACRDSIVQMRIPLTADLSRQTDSVRPVKYVLSDTVFEKEKVEEEKECDNQWEVSVEIGKSWNSIPRLDDPVQHTQTNGSQITGTLEVSRMFAPWFQLGLSASYVVLSYQDDINYPGYVPGTYNTIYLGKPIIPIQLFGKFNFGKPVGWQSSVQISFGYSVPTNEKIENSGVVLDTKPEVKGDFTAGLKFGLAYYFTCHIGLGATFTGQYFNNKSDLIAYSLYALPIQAGLHFRF